MSANHTTEALRRDAIEHAMRTTSELSAVVAFRACEPGSREALRALGVLVSAAAVSLSPASPLVAFCRGTHVDESWRERTAPAEQCLYGELEMLRTLYGAKKADDALDELLTLRELAEHDLSF